MAFQAYASAIPGSMLTAAFWNQYVRDNGNDIRAGGVAMLNQAAGDFPYATSGTQWSRLPFTDTTTFIQGGSPPYAKVGIGYQSMWIPARALTPARDDGFKTAALFDCSPAAWAPIVTLPFAPREWNITSTTIALPRRFAAPQNMLATVYWTTYVPGGGNVQWYLWVCECYSDGENFDAWPAWNGAAVTDYPNGARLLNVSPTFSLPIGNVSYDGLTRINVARYGGNDTFGDYAGFIGLFLEFPTDRLTDDF